MEQISHKQLTVNGISMHVAEVGEGPAAVLFLHGFPELWYSWRHQMVGVAAKGYRAIAPDLRGYGDTDAPAASSSYTVHHIVGDLVALLDALGLEQVFLVGHDWGAIIAWWFCLLRPDRIKALINTSVVFHPRNPNVKTIQGYREAFGDGFYMCRFQCDTGTSSAVVDNGKGSEDINSNEDRSDEEEEEQEGAISPRALRPRERLQPPKRFSD